MFLYTRQCVCECVLCLFLCHLFYRKIFGFFMVCSQNNCCITQVTKGKENIQTSMFYAVNTYSITRRCWVNFQCWGVLLVCMIVGQGPIALAVGAGGGCLDIFSLICLFPFLSPSLWETARYRLKYCLKGPLNPKQPTNQPTNKH